MTLSWLRFRHRPVLVVMLLPSLLLIGIFSYYPALRSLIGGFYTWNGFSPPVYSGITQFKQYVQSATFGTEAKNIAILTGGSIAITLVSQFTAAEVVTHMPRRAGTVAKYLLVLPIVLPPLILIEVWAYLLQPGSGLVDVFLRAAGLPQPAWLSDPHLVLASLLLIGFPWISNLGFLIFLGGLQNLPKDVLDASTIDGVGALKRVFTIDVPLLLPQFDLIEELTECLPDPLPDGCPRWLLCCWPPAWPPDARRPVVQAVTVQVSSRRCCRRTPVPSRPRTTRA